jgi:uncharacterized protein YbjT (DUF2867 family)
MKIVVIGGSGLIGGKVVERLRRQGHEVLAASPASGVDTITGEGLTGALAGAQVVVDVANSPSFEDKAVLAFFETSGRNLLAAERAAGVRHHVALSVVGTDRLQESGYFRGKLAQEALIQDSGVPHTIVRSTQFFEFLGSIAQAGANGSAVHISPAWFQPIAADDVARAVAEAALSEPRYGMVEVAGPDHVRLSDLVRRFLERKQDPREVVDDREARYFGALLQDQTLLPGDGARIGATDFESWLGSQANTRPRAAAASRPSQPAS